MASESIRIMCPNLTCKKLLGVPKAARGKMVRCRSCGTHIRVPAQPVQTQNPPSVPEQRQAG